MAFKRSGVQVPYPPLDKARRKNALRRALCINESIVSPALSHQRSFVVMEQITLLPGILHFGCSFCDAGNEARPALTHPFSRRVLERRMGNDRASGARRIIIPS